MKIRKLIARVHLWLSMLIGVFIIAITLSGTTLVFRPEIEHIIYADQYHGTPGSMRIADIEKAALAHYPDQKVSAIDRQIGDTVYEVQMKGNNPLYVYIDAGTGKVLGARHPDATFFGWVKNFHTELLLGDTGQLILGSIGLAFLVILITGGYLWWPGIKKWAIGFTVRLKKRSWYIRHYDLHKIVGICVLPFLLLIVTAGISFCFGSQMKMLWYALTFSQSTAPATLASTVVDSNTKALDEDTLVAKATALIPDGTFTMYIAPAKKTAPAQVRFSVPYDPRAGSGFDGEARIYLDQYSGKVLWDTDPRKLSLSENIYENWRFALHIGSYGHQVTRIIQVIVGIAPTFLAITGISMWYLKNRARKKQRTTTKAQAAQTKVAATQTTEAQPVKA